MASYQIPTITIPGYFAGTAGVDNYVGTSGSDFFQMGVNYNVLDTIDGSKGTDTLSYQNADRAVTVTMGAPGETGHTEAEFVTFRLTNTRTGETFEQTETQTVTEFKAVENVIGSRFDDTILANSAANRLEGGDGHDEIRGGLGNDVIIGGRGGDVLYGDNGILAEVGGADTFVFTSFQDSSRNPRLTSEFVPTVPIPGFDVDTIMDFEPGIDKIDLSAIDANSQVSGNQAFRLLDWDEQFTGTPGELYVVDYDAQEQWESETLAVTKVLGDIDGDGQYDFNIQVRMPESALGLTAADFIL
jgi:serralysin